MRRSVHGFRLPGSADRAGMNQGTGGGAGRLFDDGPFIPAVPAHRDRFGLLLRAERAGADPRAGGGAGRLFGDGPCVPAVRKLRNRPGLLGMADLAEADLMAGACTGGLFDGIPFAPDVICADGQSVSQGGCGQIEDHGQHQHPDEEFPEFHGIPSLIWFRMDL